jgi:hypothetical protein
VCRDEIKEGMVASNPGPIAATCDPLTMRTYELFFHARHTYYLIDRAPFGGEIPIWLSLTVIIITLLITAVASLVKSRWDDDHLDSQLTSPDQPDRAISTQEQA